MGTDIHTVFQKKTENGWEDIPHEYNENRHYQLFAVLADVRNGYGFAGIITGEPVVPISEPRGLPKDFLVEGGCSDTHILPNVDCAGPWTVRYWKEHQEYFKDDNVLEKWMGDHSHSWLTGQEMLEWYERDENVIQFGVVTKKFYDEWDGVTPPESYAGDVCGPNIKVVNSYELDDEDEDVTHVRISWVSELADELQYFFKEIKRLQDLHGEIRMVFGFDS